MKINENLIELIKYLTNLSEKIIKEFFPTIKMSKEIEENQVIISNGLSFIYIECLDNIFHLSAFDQMNQEQRFCIEINIADNIVNQESIIKDFESELISYFKTISVGILKLNYQNIHNKLSNLVQEYDGQYIEVSQYDFCLEQLSIEIRFLEKNYLIELEFKNYNNLNGGIYFKPLGSNNLLTNNPNDSMEIIDSFINKIIRHIKNLNNKSVN